MLILIKNINLLFQQSASSVINEEQNLKKKLKNVIISPFI